MLNRKFLLGAALLVLQSSVALADSDVYLGQTTLSGEFSEVVSYLEWTGPEYGRANSIHSTGEFGLESIEKQIYKFLKSRGFIADRIQLLQPQITKLKKSQKGVSYNNHPAVKDETLIKYQYQMNVSFLYRNPPPSNNDIPLFAFDDAQIQIIDTKVTGAPRVVYSPELKINSNAFFDEFAGGEIGMPYAMQREARNAIWEYSDKHGVDVSELSLRVEAYLGKSNKAALHVVIDENTALKPSNLKDVLMLGSGFRLYALFEEGVKSFLKSVKCGGLFRKANSR